MANLHAHCRQLLELRCLISARNAFVWLWFSSCTKCFFKNFAMVVNMTSLVIGILLDDLLVAQDFAAVEVAEATLHASASSPASNASDICLQKQRNSNVDETARQTLPEAESDGPVLLDKPVAPPLEGSVNSDISTENALAESPR